MHDVQEFTHLSEAGHVRMVDVGNKNVTERTARAEAIVRLGAGLAERLSQTGSVEKGGVIETARIAGIMAAKQTSNLIPLCHQIPLNVVAIDAVLDGELLRLESSASCSHTTGVEMEAMTAVTVAALTVYDMCKSVDRNMTIEHVRLEEKSGGRSGHYLRESESCEPN